MDKQVGDISWTTINIALLLYEDLKWIWKSNVPSKVCVFGWRIMQNRSYNWYTFIILYFLLLTIKIVKISIVLVLEIKEGLGQYISMAMS